MNTGEIKFASPDKFYENREMEVNSYLAAGYKTGDRVWYKLEEQSQPVLVEIEIAVPSEKNPKSGAWLCK